MGGGGRASLAAPLARAAPTPIPAPELPARGASGRTRRPFLGDDAKPSACLGDAGLPSRGDGDIRGDGGAGPRGPYAFLVGTMPISDRCLSTGDPGAFAVGRRMACDPGVFGDSAAAAMRPARCRLVAWSVMPSSIMSSSDSVRNVSLSISWSAKTRNRCPSPLRSSHVFKTSGCAFPACRDADAVEVLR